MNELTTTANFTIDEGFKNLIPPLIPEEYAALEKECINYGIRDALVIAHYPEANGLVLIDGHNRYEISRKHNLAFKTERLDFPSRKDAEAWIIRNQLARRNISNYVRAELALRLKPIIAEKAKEKQSEAGGAVRQKSDKAAIDTKRELAKAAGVSHDTIHKVEKIQARASEEAKQALRRGETSINKVYGDIIASENETRRQEEARELREAKGRARDYQISDGKVASFGEAKQHKNDNELIFHEFSEEVGKMYVDILRAATSTSNELTMNAVRATDKRELIALNDKISECYRTILKIQRRIVEVIDEK